MTTNKIMLKFAKIGINLSPTQYDIVKEKYDNAEYKEEYLDTVIAIAKYNMKSKNINPNQIAYDVQLFVEVITWEK